jgi:HAMP domain-containing protein
VPETQPLPLVAPGAIALRILPGEDALAFRVGVAGGMATGTLSKADLRQAALDAAPNVAGLILRDGNRDMPIVPPAFGSGDGKFSMTRWPVGNGQLEMNVGTRIPEITTGDRLILLLPFLMWLVAALLAWVLVNRLFIRPLRQLQRSVVRYEPGDAEFPFPDKLGPATEIQELRDAFAGPSTAVEESEQSMAGALEGQRRLVREVHHRVKNNLQVVASLINIHGRSAETPQRAALCVDQPPRRRAVDRPPQPFRGDGGESRNRASALLSELAAELRARAPSRARAADRARPRRRNTTQDVAVAVAFLSPRSSNSRCSTPEDPSKSPLRRTSELTARLT